MVQGKAQATRTALLTGLAVSVLGLLSACTNTSGSVLPVTGGPPVGTYVCWAGGFNRLYSGSFTIHPDGKYVGIENRDGHYLYQPNERKIVFTSGDYEYWDFVAVYQKSSEASDGRERLVLRDESEEAPVGMERPGRSHYCYLEEPARAEQYVRESQRQGQ